MSIFGLLLSLAACSRGSDSSARDNADSSLPAQSIFYHIQAAYEVIETGEYIAFDYIMSCFNDEVPGSFKGVLKPRNMFKATSTGAAIAISPPKHYCERAIKGIPLEKANDVLKMPILMWYPDVNDLSYTLLYMTNDAYTGPNAKVRFKSYSFSKSDRASFLAWERKARAEYKQIGAIPGPFGCNSVDTGSSFACGRDDFVARNNGYFLAVEGSDFFNPHVYISMLPENVANDYREYLNVNHRYYCRKVISSQAGKQYQRNLMFGDSIKQPGNLPEYLKSYDTHRKYVQSPENLRREVYLDPVLLLRGNGDRPVAEVYPKVRYTRFENKPSSGNINQQAGRKIKRVSQVTTQILAVPEWRGFAILNYQRPISDYFPEIISPNYADEYAGALYWNDTLICEDEFVGSDFQFYDLARGSVIRVR